MKKTKLSKLVRLSTSDTNPVTVPFSLFKGDFYVHLAGGEFRRMLLSERFNPQHLYLVSLEDDIQNGDWYYDSNDNIINKAGANQAPTNYQYKILATTDKSIGYTDTSISPVPNFCEYPCISKETIDLYIKLGENEKEVLYIQESNSIIFKKTSYTNKEVRELLDECWEASLDFNKPAGMDSGINKNDWIQSKLIW